MYTSTKMSYFQFSTVFLCLFVFVYVCYVFPPVTCHGHEHGHSHGHEEPPSFKYSQQANEDLHNGHGHSHGGHGHGHSHGGHGNSHEHGHSHGDHGHGHSHEDHGHGHAHGDHGHGHSHGSHGHGHSHGDSGCGHGHSHGGPGKRDVEEPHGHSHDHHHEHIHPENTAKPKVVKHTGVTLWAEAIIATLIISISPIFILVFIPLDHTEKHQPLLKILLSFASGGLLGDAFLHLIPHAVSPHSHGGDDHGHTHAHAHADGEGHSHDMSVGIWVLAGIIVFLMVEKFVRIVKGGHTHSHSHSAPVKETEKESKEKKLEAMKEKAKDLKDEKVETKDEKETTEDKKEKVKEVTDKKTDEVKSVEETPVEDIKVAGYLNLAADFAHNFTDGLAIGASFMMGQSLGIITTITIFLHEIPHEIGDFAILVQSGCTKKKAMMLQFSTAIGAMMGTISSLFAEGIGEAATAWILPFTAGGFIYIATVSVIPELLEDTKLGQSIKEILALFVGVYMMVLIGQYE